MEVDSLYLVRDGGGKKGGAAENDSHGKVLEKGLQLVIGGGVRKVADVQPPALSSRGGVSGIGLAGVFDDLVGEGEVDHGGEVDFGALLDRGVLDSFGDGFDRVGSRGRSVLDRVLNSVLDSSSGDSSFGVGGHDWGISLETLAGVSLKQRKIRR